MPVNRSTESLRRDRSIVQSIVLVAVLLFAFSFASVAQAADADNDGVSDQADNCVAVFNEYQLDGDGDGVGNACDFDYNNDGSIDSADAALLQAAFGTDLDVDTASAAFDADEDGRVAGSDWVAFTSAQ